MDQLDKHNAFKKIIPTESLTDKDKQAVLGTIENAKLFMEAFDLLSVKHVQTRLKIIETISGGNDDKS
ncbi:MAG: hypothetical protein R2753_12765 [Chitinophagales bacterium]